MITALRPRSDVVAKRLIAYLFRTEKFDWAGGRRADHEKRFPNQGKSDPLRFLERFDGIETLKTVVEHMGGVHFEQQLTPSFVASNSAFNVTVTYFPFPLMPVFYDHPVLPSRPLGFYHFVERTCVDDDSLRVIREEGASADDAEAVEICDELLAMKRTARVKCACAVESAINKHRNVPLRISAALRNKPIRIG